MPTKNLEAVFSGCRMPPVIRIPWRPLLHLPAQSRVRAAGRHRRTSCIRLSVTQRRYFQRTNGTHRVYAIGEAVKIRFGKIPFRFGAKYRNWRTIG